MYTRTTIPHVCYLGKDTGYTVFVTSEEKDYALKAFKCLKHNLLVINEIMDAVRDFFV